MKKVIGSTFHYLFNEETYKEIYVTLLNEKLPLEDPQLILDKVVPYEYEKKLIRYDKDLNQSIWINGAGVTSISFWKQNHKYPIYSISICVDYENINNNLEYFDKFTKIKGLIFGALYDYNDEYWQSQQDIEQYKLNNKKYAHLPQGKNWLQRPCIDVSKNFGRSVVECGIKFIAAPIMYFGQPIFKILDENKLKSFSNCESNFIEGDILKIQLTKNFFYKSKIAWFTKTDKQYRERQKAFWEWVDLEAKICYLNTNYSFDGYPF